MGLEAGGAPDLPPIPPHPEVPRSGLEGELPFARDPWSPPSRLSLRRAPQDEGVGGRDFILHNYEHNENPARSGSRSRSCPPPVRPYRCRADRRSASPCRPGGRRASVTSRMIRSIEIKPRIGQGTPPTSARPGRSPRGDSRRRSRGRGWRGGAGRGGPAGIVAAGLAGLDMADLEDRRLQPHHGPHRVRTARLRIAAEQGIARRSRSWRVSPASQVPDELASEARARGNAARRRAKSAACGVDRVGGTLGTDEVAHHEVDAGLADHRIARELQRLRHGQSEPVHAVSTWSAAGRRPVRDGGPFGQFLPVAENRAQGVPGEGRPRAGGQTVEDVDRRSGRSFRAAIPSDRWATKTVRQPALAKAGATADRPQP